MKVSQYRTFQIIVISLCYTGYTCLRAILMGLSGRITRKWCDEELRRWLVRVLRSVKVTCTVINPYQIEPQSGQPTIIMCNHSSLYDIPLSYLAFPHHSIRMLSKKELSNIPLMGSAMVASEFPFVDRKNRTQAIKDLEQVKSLMKSGIVMWIAPEGTRSKDGKVAPFKKGAFITAIQTGATIIPMGIRGAYDILPARTHQFNLNQKAEIHIGKPIDASKFTLDEKEQLVQQVFECITDLVHKDEIVH